MDNVVHLETIQQPTDRFDRVALGRRGKRKEVEVYLPGLLLKGQSHLFYGASDTGKSCIAQHASAESIGDGMPVLYFDLENGPDVMEERMLDTLRVSQEDVDDHLHYFPFIYLTMDRESKVWFTSLLDSFPEPGLVVWDSLLGFLSLAGLKEDSSDDFETWARFYLDQPRARGWTSMVLDHTGHAGTHARGTSRKKDNVQVEFKVEKKQPFDRTTSGRQKLTREKDRLAYLPEQVEITLGGTPFEFRTRYDGQEFLTNSHNTALFLLYKCGLSGATHKEWKELCTTGDKGMSESTFNRAARELKKKKYVDRTDKHYTLTKKGESKVS